MKAINTYSETEAEPMGNDCFETSEYKIKNGTLIQYIGEKKKVSVAPNVAGHKLLRIGATAFQSKRLDTLILREGIEEIEAGAFSGSCIQSLMLPSTIKSISAESFLDDLPQTITISRKLSKYSWRQLQKNCIAVVDGYHLLNVRITGDAIFDTLLDIYANKAMLPGEVNEEMLTLFAVSQDRQDIVFADKKIKSQEVMRGYLIRNEICAAVNAEVDAMDDYNFRHSGSKHAGDVILCKIFVDNDASDSEHVMIKAQFVKGTYYWMRIEKIMLNGKAYFILSKEFLNADETLPYMKKFEGVYDEGAFEVKGDERKLVLRKYDLLRNVP